MVSEDLGDTKDLLFQCEQGCSTVSVESRIFRVLLDSLSVLAMRGAVILFNVELVSLNLEAFCPFNVDGLRLRHDDSSAKRRVVQGGCSGSAEVAELADSLVGVKIGSGLGLFI